MTLGKIAEACGGHLIGGNPDLEVMGVVSDSRQVQENYLFLAIKGERVDGHDFIPAAMKAGAAAAVCEEAPSSEECGAYILVGSVLQALQDMAAYYRRQLSIPVVGITGSVGKTSTKEFVASVLSQKYNVLKTEGNFNNEIGVPLTLLRIREEHEAAVVEMGINHFGEMKRLGRMAKPDVMLYTNIGECHLEFLGTRDGILKAKTEVFEEMDENSEVVVNGDDDKLITLENVHGKKPVRYGMDPSVADVYATSVVNHGLFGSDAVIHTPEGVFDAKVPLPGRHMVMNALAATAVGLRLGLSKDQIREGISSVKATSGRSNIVKTGHYVVIDDCYNANPVSMCAAIDLLNMAEGRKVAILGDMFELGENEEELHAKVGAYAAKAGIDVLLCAGSLSSNMARAAEQENAGMLVVYCLTGEELQKSMRLYLQDGDTVLVKASHGMQYQKIVDALLKDEL